MFDQLKDYSSIAWDFDDTLVGHIKSKSFWDFIYENPYGQVHHIITMRTHGWQHTMFAELHEADAHINADHFEHVLNVPDFLYEQYARAKAHGLVLSPEHPYFLFKGEECRRIGAQVLIDDMESNGLSVRGCEVHGIQHIHPDAL